MKIRLFEDVRPPNADETSGSLETVLDRDGSGELRIERREVRRRTGYQEVVDIEKNYHEEVLVRTELEIHVGK